ncbi:MAG: ferrous iron transport protein B [Pseudomonadota bacterium]
MIVALIGNPNSGKTTLFNNLTGAHQRVGNWPGVTVEKKTGFFSLDGQEIELVDLPGIYSLEQEYPGLDEKIAHGFLLSGDIDLVVNIVDASNLERNLVLTQQLQDHGVPMVIALNMLDVAEQQGVRVDAAALEGRLGVVVVPIVASRGTGIDALMRAIGGALVTGRERALLVTRPNPLAQGETASELIVRRYHRSRALLDGVMEVVPVSHTLTERIDNWVLNRWLGVPVFLLMIYLMFTVSVNVGAVFIDFFDILFGALFVDGLRWAFELSGAPEWLVVLAADGLGGGVQLVATFIPVIGVLFLCLSLLEDSGYLSRAAFVVDRLMASIGLPGTAFVPLIVGFGCNVPAVMASRSLGRDSDRLMTIAMAPFMSCGARLTVYALFAAAFFAGNGANIVFLLYLLGISMAVLTGWMFRRQIFGEEVSPSFQEMPAYHVPVLRNVLLTTWFRLRSFVFRAGKTIVLVVMALSFLNSLSFDGTFGHENSEKSALATIGKQITPVFSPMGITTDNWAATVGLFTGLFAKEAVVGTLDALYSSGGTEVQQEGPPDVVAAFGEALGSILDNASGLGDLLLDPLGIGSATLASELADAAESQGVQADTLTNMAGAFGSQFAAFCYLVFVLLYAPCVAVLGAITKEAGWRWMVLVFCWATGLAYMTATGIYQVGTFTLHPGFSSVWLAGSLGVLVLFFLQLKRIGTRVLPSNLIPVVPIN